MRNLLILGTGRSGTSMISALFRHSGAYLGDNLLAARAANPFGYYEDPEVNALNTRVIERMVAALWTTRLCPRLVHPVHRREEAAWLAAPWYLPRVDISRDERAAMHRKLSHMPFCLKDPRFSVTLPAWRPYLPPDTRFLVAFRDPQRTVDSILRDARETYSPPLPADAHWAALCWWRNYGRLLHDFACGGDWLFVHYDGVVNGTALRAIANFAEAELDTRQVDRSVSRAQPAKLSVGRRLGNRCALLYEQLQARASADLQRWSQSMRPHRLHPPAAAKLMPVAC
jgi:hypothetical protein